MTTFDVRTLKANRVEQQGMELMSLGSAISGVKAIMSAYDGYERKRFLDTDFAVREELRRRTDMLTDHLNRVHDRLTRHEDQEAAAEVRDAKATLTGLAADVQFAISSAPTSAHTSIGRLGRSPRRQLVNHDLRTLEMLVSATRTCNDLLELSATSATPQEDVQALCARVHDQVGRARNHLRERNMFIEGLMKR